MYDHKQNNRILRMIGKVLLSGILAFAVLTVGCMLYYNLPVHYTCEDGASDYRWESHKFYSTWKEGFAWGRTNNEGYMNAFDYTPQTQVDVLILGSSHMEARNVAPDKSAAALLNERMPEKTVYNLGLSSHAFLTCASNLQTALEKYAPTDCVIETSTLAFSNQDIQLTVNGEFPEIDSHSEGVLALLQSNQYIRLAYKQITYFFGTLPWEKDTDTQDTAVLATENTETNEELLNALLAKMAKMASDRGTRLIILYHPATEIDADGNLVLGKYDGDAEQFAALCEENGILFLNMAERFRAAYEENFTVPHGFCNTTVGNGHLNEAGHEMIAEELYRILTGEVA